MKKLLPILPICACLATANAQSIDFELYETYRSAHESVTFDQLLNEYPTDEYFSEDASTFNYENAQYFDRFVESMQITSQERDLLDKNRFMVTERLSYSDFGTAYKRVFENDLPLMVTSDLILHAMHMSYDQMLLTLEIQKMLPNLRLFTDALYEKIPELNKKYGNNKSLSQSVADADIFVTVAKSLLSGEAARPQVTSSTEVSEVLAAITDEKAIQFALYTNKPRWIDFSQFTPRGHYVNKYGNGAIEQYFKCMMWYGFIEIMLSNPNELQFSDDDIKRQVITATMINELIAESDALQYVKENDEIISYFIGPVDNVGPEGLKNILTDAGVNTADELLSDEKYANFEKALSESPENKQRILSAMIYRNDTTVTYASYKVLGQRFIFDSFIFTNTSHGQVMKRMMPDPLDAMFVLGNNNALHLLKEDIGTYAELGTELASLRYLSDNLGDDYWSSAVYTNWLKAFSELSSGTVHSQSPYFMKTASWQHEKLNTQLASWAELRHDNLLYAKQSYSEMAGCSFPEHYVEAYPEFYSHLSEFAKELSGFMDGKQTGVSKYWSRFGEIMDTLNILSVKELEREPFNSADTAFMNNFLFKVESDGYWESEIDGWITDLFYGENTPETSDYIVADVHTQPTDEVGNIVGNVLHLGTGKINLGVFIAPSTLNSEKPTAYVGAVMSFYEEKTADFKRLTDQDWGQLLDDGNLPQRPDWTQYFLAPNKSFIDEGRRIPGVRNYTDEYTGLTNAGTDLFSLSPVPVFDVLNVNGLSEASTEIIITNVSGFEVFKGKLASGQQQIDVSFLPKGAYACMVKTDGKQENHLFVKL